MGSTMASAAPTECFGWLAAGLTWLTFFCREMRRLRCLALGANMAFIAHGWGAGLGPVLALHLALMPVNLWRMSQIAGATLTGKKARSGATQAPAPITTPTSTSTPTSRPTTQATTPATPHTAMPASPRTATPIAPLA